MPDNDPFDHGAFLREIEWYNTSVKYGGGKPEPYSPSLPSSSIGTSTRGRGGGRASGNSPVGTFVIFALSSFCFLGVLCAGSAKLFGEPNLCVRGGNVVLTCFYARFLSRVRKWHPQGFFASVIHTGFFLTLCLGPIFFVMSLANAN